MAQAEAEPNVYFSVSDEVASEGVPREGPDGVNVRQGSHPYSAATLSRACVTSAIKSSRSSQPTESRTMKSRFGIG